MVTKKAVTSIKAKSFAVKTPPKKSAFRSPTVQKKSSTISSSTEDGFKIIEGGELLVPTSFATKTIVAPNKLQAGLKASQGQIKQTLRNLTTIFTQDFEVAEIELSVGFNADGKFLGFGMGGDVSIKVKIRPTK